MTLSPAKISVRSSDAIQTREAAHVVSEDFQSSNQIHELIHEIRQPLEVIESLAFYLEMVSAESRVSQHLQTIRSMVGRANQILEAHVAP